MATGELPQIQTHHDSCSTGCSSCSSEHTHPLDYTIIIRLVISLAFLALSFFTVSPISTVLLITSYLISGYDVLLKAGKSLLGGLVMDEHVLMTVATLGAFAIGDYKEAVAVMAFYQTGEFVQSLAVQKSRSSITSLLDIKAVSATILKDGKQVTIDPALIVPGDIILIKAGERVAVDGQIVTGNSTIDVSALTGESIPRFVQVQDHILGGSINGSGVLHVRATATYEDSTVATMLRLVEESSHKKAPTERFISRFARYYTPTVVSLAALLTLLPPLIGLGTLSFWFHRALVFLVISCPCALVISVPLGFFGGIGGLSRMGVLVKGGNYIQTLSEAKHLVFDKTGTLSKGVFTVSAINSYDSAYSEEEILLLAASVEQHSAHPLAQTIAQAAQGEFKEVTEITEIPGKGISGIYNGHSIAVGSASFAKELSGQSPPPLAHSGSYLLVDNHLIGSLELRDQLKTEAKAAVKQLKKLGINELTILSGDQEAPVAQVAQELEIEDYRHSLLPQQKLEYIETALRPVVFVGDGINDSPVLAFSDVGIAMGAIGSDAAIEASDVVIMGDDVAKIPLAIAHSRRTMSIVKQNIVFAIGVKIIVMALATVGIASMWTAVFADTGVALLAVVNSLRALRKRI
ncbi:MAG: heavy metal translocating P-type ATPase [Sphaerochaetaceae bacterium]